MVYYIIVILLCYIGVSWAGDPFAIPAALQSGHSDVSNGRNEDYPIVHGLLTMEDGYRILIGSEVYKPGDHVNGVHIHVEDARVVLSSDHGVRNVELYP